MSVAVRRARFGIDPAASLLLTDLYELNMYGAYLKSDMTDTAVFEFFVRKLPRERNFLLAAGLEQALQFLEQARITEAELAWLEASGRFLDARTLASLAAFRFTGEVYALPEGTPIFADEPILGIEAPLPEAQLLESRLINLLQLSDADRFQGGPDGAGGTGQAAAGFRPAPRAWGGGRAARRPRRLSRGLRRYCHHAR